MPVRNGMPWLPWAVDDLAKSSVNLEILICDDGSFDGSADFLQKLKEECAKEPKEPKERRSDAEVKESEGDQRELSKAATDRNGQVSESRVSEKALGFERTSESEMNEEKFTASTEAEPLFGQLDRFAVWGI